MERYEIKKITQGQTYRMDQTYRYFVKNSYELDHQKEKKEFQKIHKLYFSNVSRTRTTLPYSVLEF